MRAAIASLGLMTLALGGCGDHRAHTACTGGIDSSLVTGAALFELDDFGAANHCAGSSVSDTSLAPLSSHTFAPGTPISLSLSPGAHTLVLYAFSDASATTVIGSGCVETTLAAGGDFCFDLSLTPVVDTGSSDLAGVGGGGGGGGGGAGSGGGGGGGGGSCEVTHTDGLGDNFVDCVPLGTQDTTQAHKAANAWDATGVIDALARSYSDNKGSLLYICDQSTARNACACWTWNGTGNYAGVGHALATAGKPSQCFIPFNGTYPAWN